ncbi:hypothetical protein WHR41_09225 [Cladosporium halotolerans]|uniref:Uncharacterized protein n=1 Tax=Cladosporium halotolerans TaxID=1052096 RepID=A0AB34KEA2_9PEZI
MTSDTLLTSSATVRSSITATFKQKQEHLKNMLQSAKSRIHITTDTWHSPSSTELQAINAHFVDEHGQLRKALLNLAELEDGHSGRAVAKHVLQALAFYGVKGKTSWNPVDNRLRCLGRIINLAVQAFLFARNEEAVAEAERQPQRCKTDIDLEIAAGSIKEDGRGWSTILPLQKLHTLTSRLDRSDKLKLQFGKLAKGRTIHADNETRWNSWYFTIDSALKLQFEIAVQRSDQAL